MDRRIPILYIAGSPRTGTTLLSRLLALQADHRALGEPHHIALAFSWPLICGCGKPHQDCETWGPHIARMTQPEPQKALRRVRSASDRDQLASYLAPSRERAALTPGLEEIRRIYAELGADGKILVDESKSPWYGHLLAHQPWADVHFVELLRHPADVISSRARPKEYQPVLSRETAAKQWLRSCLTTDVVRLRTGQPWYRTAYDRLAAEPEQVLRDIIGRAPSGLAAGTFESPANHLFVSNADKLRRGPETVRPPSGEPPSPHPDAGRWEKLAVAYWDRWLAGRTELRRGWRTFEASQAGQPAKIDLTAQPSAVTG